MVLNTKNFHVNHSKKTAIHRKFANGSDSHSIGSKPLFYKAHFLLVFLLGYIFGAQKSPHIVVSFFSDDGYYATWQVAPRDGGQWSIEAVSLSQYHGLRAASPKSVLRTIPLNVDFDGLPSTVKRDEVLPQMNITLRSNMPVDVNVSQITTFCSAHFFSFPPAALLLPL